MESYTNSHKPVHIAILPAPGTGHLNPLLEFSKRLIQLSPSTFSITFIIIPTSSSDQDSKKLSESQISFLSTLSHHDSQQVSFISLPSPNFDKEEFSSSKEEISAKVFLTIKRSLPRLRDILITLSSGSSNNARLPISSLVVDMFTTDAIDLALELGIEPYMCFQSSAMALRVYSHLPEMDRTVNGEFIDMKEPVALPGCVPLYGMDLPNPALDRKSARYRWFLDHTKRFGLAKGIILNSFDALEQGVFRALRDGKQPIYPIGPLTKKTTVSLRSNIEVNRDGSLKWLDQQPPESVLFVSFGSGGTLSTIQVTEIASGLEISGQRFLWVFRVPNDNITCGSYLTINQENNPLDYLPEGFLKRTQGRGLVVPNWAPQVSILSHGSTGGFLTHCGWNSILESVVSGVPFIAWPLYAEQSMNAVFLEQHLKVAQRVRPDTPDGLVKREQVVRLVKNLMDDTEERKVIVRKMKEIKQEAAKAMSHGGTSNIALCELAVNLSCA